MSLKGIMAKLGNAKVATATPATVATLETHSLETVAKVAGVAVATREETASSPECLGESDDPISEWRAMVESVAPSTPDIVKLREESLRFLDSSDALEAVANEWDAVSLFGVHKGTAPRQRVDCWGLVLFLAWGVHRATVEAFDQKACAIRTRSGAVQTLPRIRANFDQAIPWWQHPATLEKGT